MIDQGIIDVLIQIPFLGAVLYFIWRLFERLNATMNEITRLHHDSEQRFVEALNRNSVAIRNLTMANLDQIDDASTIKKYILTSMKEEDRKKERSLE